MKPDITHRDDIIRLVDAFYGHVRRDATIGFIFDEVAQVDWPHHLPKMYDFWSGILLGESGYTGNVMASHLELAKKTPLGEKEFSAWIRLFHQTVDELFEGQKATEAKTRADAIAQLMQFKINGQGQR